MYTLEIIITVLLYQLLSVIGSLEALSWSRGVLRQQCVTLILVLLMYIKTLALVLDNTSVLVLKLLKTQGKAYYVLLWPATVSV